jgi:hypothetical protein
MNELIAIVTVSIIIFGVIYLSGKSLDKPTDSVEYLNGWEAFKSEI